MYPGVRQSIIEEKQQDEHNDWTFIKEDLHNIYNKYDLEGNKKLSLAEFKLMCIEAGVLRDKNKRSIDF